MVRTIRHAEWVSATRVLAALLAPLAVGAAIDDVALLVPVAAGGLIGALADPGCSTQRRSLTISATAVLGAVCFLLGSAIGGSQILALAFIGLVAFLAGLAPEFGTAGTRGASYVAICAAVGISAANQGGSHALTAWGLLAGGAWALFLALGPFRQPGSVRHDVRERMRFFLADLSEHVGLRTALGRHAARMGLAAAGAMTASFVLGRPFVGWIAVAALTMLRPDSPSTSPATSARFVLATVAGAAGALLVFALADTRSVVLVAALVALFFAVGLRSSSKTAFTALMTLGTLGLLAQLDPGFFHVADDRVIDTLIGAAIALGVWRLSSSRAESTRLDRELARL